MEALGPHWFHPLTKVSVKERTETDFTKTQAGKVTVQWNRAEPGAFLFSLPGLLYGRQPGEGRLQTPLRFFFHHPPVTNLNIYAHKQAEDLDSTHISC